MNYEVKTIEQYIYTLQLHKLNPFIVIPEFSFHTIDEYKKVLKNVFQLDNSEEYLGKPLTILLSEKDVLHAYQLLLMHLINKGKAIKRFSYDIPLFPFY